MVHLRSVARPSSKDLEGIRRKFKALSPLMDERSRRMWAASEARELGWGAVTCVAQATGLSRTTITAGLRELGKASTAQLARSRRPGAGRPKADSIDPGLRKDLQRLVESTTRGDPESPLRWTCKSLRNLAAELSQHRRGRRVDPKTVARLLHEMEYRLQAARKTREGEDHPDRDRQFEYINRRVRWFQRQGEPVISVDTKKKELVGDFYNKGRGWHRKGTPEPVRVHDFIDEELGKAVPYGVYDVKQNLGWVNVGVDHDTPEFAVESIRRWWRKTGAVAYPNAQELLITADAGGSNGYRCHAWKVQLQRLANDTGLKITVVHFPPGTSKWNKIEHRMFCHITQNWRGRPLVSHEVVVKLIGGTKTHAGLRVRAALDRRSYEKGKKTTPAELEALHIHRAAFHGDWNYSISPATT
jgi:transposase